MDAERLHEIEEMQEQLEILDAMGHDVFNYGDEKDDDMKETLIKDALNNLLPDSGASDDYCQGIILGLMSAIMAKGMTFDRALNHLAKLARPQVRMSGVPECWKEDWKKAIALANRPKMY